MKLYFLIGITAAALMFSVIGAYSLIFSVKNEKYLITVDADAEAIDPIDAGATEKRRFIAIVCDNVCKNAPHLVRVAFCKVILNRCASSEFPDTPAEVVFFDPIFSEAYCADFTSEPSQRSLMAYDDAALGFSPCEEALYFRTSDTYDPTLVRRSTVLKIGKYYFS